MNTINDPMSTSKLMRWPFPRFWAPATYTKQCTFSTSHHTLKPCHSLVYIQHSTPDTEAMPLVKRSQEGGGLSGAMVPLKRHSHPRRAATPPTHGFRHLCAHRFRSCRTSARSTGMVAPVSWSKAVPGTCLFLDPTLGASSNSSMEASTVLATPFMAASM